MQMRFVPSFVCESLLIELIVSEMPSCSCNSKREYRELGGNTFLLDQKQKYSYKCLRCGGENLLIRQITVNDELC